MTRRTKEEIDAWLKDLYLECVQNNIPQEQRIDKVWWEIDDFLGVQSIKDIPEKKYAIQWMSDSCKSGIDLLPIPIFAFYFDTVFWEVKILPRYGITACNPIDALTDMPNILKNELYKTLNKEYEFFWVNCMDLIAGLDDIRIQSDHPLHSNQIVKDFLFSAVENLNAATSVLLHPIPNSQSIMSIRMALEMFIKSYVLLHEKSTVTQPELEARARKIGHNLKDGLDAITVIRPNIINSKDYEILKIFPDNIGEQRYIPQNVDIYEIASSYALTLHIGAVVTRSITNRNLLNQ